MKDRHTYRQRERDREKVREGEGGERECVCERGGGGSGVWENSRRKYLKKKEGARKLSQNQLPKQTTCRER